MKISNTLLWIVVLAIGGWLVFSSVQTNQSFGVVDTSTITLAGTSSYFTSVASSTSATATVTPYAVSTFGTSTINQQIYTASADNVRLNIAAKGGTATSTLSYRVYGSNDGTNWWDYGVYDDYYASSTSALGETATSTLPSKISIFAFDPGTATSTRSFYFPVLGWKQLRFVFLGEDVTADPNDGVGMWVEANLIGQL